MHKNLGTFLEALRREGDLREITSEVDPYLEIAEIHRRVIDEGGPALLFSNVRNSRFPVVTNLFGTAKRIETGFGKMPKDFVRRAVEMVEVLLPPKPTELWKYRDMAYTGLKLGVKSKSYGPVIEGRMEPPDLEKIPLLQLWPEDGGHFVTLPLVYTESPSTGKHNLGMYRLQRYGPKECGIHWQIHKGGGFHYFEAERRAEALPINVFLGGPPSMILAAIAPLPEDVPELMLASLLNDGKIETIKSPVEGGLRLLSEAEFVISGQVPPLRRKPEGPFGDHYGYYSLQHKYPVIEVQNIYHRKGAIYPATVVGKPRQEDFFIGDYLQELLSPLFPLVMPAVIDLWSYGETGFHSLAAAVVKERYAREALGAGFRILGEGQLSLTKFLMLTDKPQDLRDFKSLFEHILERVDWATDFFIFDRTSFDTLDYASGKINHGSKAMLIGVGESKRELEREFNGDLPGGITAAKPFCGGCLVLEADDYASDKDLKERISKDQRFRGWQVVVLHDSIEFADSADRFLWATWTRFNPSTDITAMIATVGNNHISYGAPIVIDARMKPWYPAEVEPHPETVKLVDARWREYFGK
ncbi:MAG: UbiD family decarboxylase [Acidobacteria bacterium]|nr:MAG: UbiD family decarboxylase [Acidobacteriota bacterium]REK03099.1 MAG: UbiD family decarboxylase [Acidobacteriota bacterium]REK15447.1 MAG: UbiD family decarboxylase [Acidobacteriota bacterium]REK45798.1 MAG: UbiD family decarboxylase [Acidobacteriota bacterium]